MAVAGRLARLHLSLVHRASESRSRIAHLPQLCSNVNLTGLKKCWCNEALVCRQLAGLLVEVSFNGVINKIETFPKIKKFRNNKASFPLYDALGELYDGHLAEGTYNFISFESPQEEPLPHINHVEDEAQGLVDYEDDDARHAMIETNEEVLQRRADALSPDQDGEDATVQRIGQQRKAASKSRNKEGKEAKRPRKSSNIENIMERYLEIRTKQAEDEAAIREKELAREKECSQGPNNFSIARCVSVLSTMDVTKEEKAKAFVVFKNLENREIFLSACITDEESTMI